MREPNDLAKVTVEDAGRRWVDISTQPWVIEALARRAAERIAPYSVDSIACWRDPDSVVWAHAVAVALHVPVIQVVEDLGIVERANRDHRPSSRVAIVAPQWTPHVPQALLAAFLRNQGSEVRVAVALLRPENREDREADRAEFDDLTLESP